ncbi:MAG: hypothetical protein AAF993_12510 [Pseudomonadota bacterium]
MVQLFSPAAVGVLSNSASGLTALPQPARQAARQATVEPFARPEPLQTNLSVRPGTQVEASADTRKIALQLQVETREGDVIELDFSQLTARTAAQIQQGGNSLSANAESFSEQIQVSVRGELSAEEQQALDGLLSAVERAAAGFFADNPAQAVTELMQLPFDSATLSSLSLDLSLSKTTEYLQVANDSSQASLDNLRRSSGGFAELLDDLAQRQKQLIDQAQTLLQPASGAGLVRELFPAMLTLLQDAAPAATQSA